MPNLISAAEAYLLDRLPVPFARRLLQRPANERPPQGNVDGARQLLIDVSVVINNDSRTGIQRVVRALYLQLMRQPPAGWRVRPVFATRKHGYRYASDGFLRPDEQASRPGGTSAVSATPGDFFLGLDLTAHLLPLHRSELVRWRLLGVEIHIVVYDLLPVLHPDWFNPRTIRNFRRWLRTIAVFADRLICISDAVKSDLVDWLARHYSLAPGAIAIDTIALGADIEASAPDRGLPENIGQLLDAFSRKPSVLMVGTLEPRKGHNQVLAAFETLWKRGHEINLVIVGRPGWKTEALQQRLRTHPQSQDRLYWLDNVSDELLGLLYAASTGVIVASKAEGFGLPLVEALHHRKPVLARDIPVFREIGGSGITFFSGVCTESLVTNLESWLTGIDGGQTPHSAPRHTWHDCAGELLVCLGIGQAAPARSGRRLSVRKAKSIASSARNLKASSSSAPEAVPVSGTRVFGASSRGAA
ncbi:MAG: glycosyltransferase family 4 protein [Hyphomicrobiales bacterium]